MDITQPLVTYRNKQNPWTWLIYGGLTFCFFVSAWINQETFAIFLIWIPIQPLHMILQKSTAKVRMDGASLSYKEWFAKEVTLTPENIRKSEVKENKKWMQILFNMPPYSIVVSYNKYDDLSIQTDHQEVIDWFSQHVSRS